VAEYLEVAAIVLGLNLLPAFAPPTWTVLVYFRVSNGLAIAPLVVVGAVMAAAGRYVLAIVFRRLGSRLPPRRRENLEALGTAVSRSRGLLASLVFFAVSPIPSNSLFEAAGLARVRLAPLIAAFCAGRLVSYTLYLVAATKVEGKIRDVIAQGLISPRAIVLGVVGVAGLLAVVLVNWVDIIDRSRAWAARRKGQPPPPSIRRELRQEGTPTRA
jgi:membrane protein YqaA with SNARE-associated domain